MRCGRIGCWRTRLKPFPKSVCPELVEGQSFSSVLQRKNGASTSSARTVRGRAMFAPLTKPDLGKTWEDARVYLRPTCFVDRDRKSGGLGTSVYVRVDFGGRGNSTK